MSGLLYKALVGGGLAGMTIGTFNGVYKGLKTAKSYENLDDYMSGVLCIVLNSVDECISGMLYGGIFGLTFPISIPAAIIYGFQWKKKTEQPKEKTI